MLALTAIFLVFEEDFASSTLTIRLSEMATLKTYGAGYLTLCSLLTTAHIIHLLLDC